MEYNSSEELQRQHATSVFAERAQQNQTQVTTERQRFDTIIEKHINEHKHTVNVRKLATETGRSIEYQLNLSADLVEVLEQIQREVAHGNRSANNQ